MSFFISSMSLDGLMSSPPVSKQTPLPTSVTFGAVGRPRQVDQARRAGAGPADRMDQRKILLQQIVADDAANVAPNRCRQRRAACVSSAGPMSLDGVLMRSRASDAGLRHPCGSRRHRHRLAAPAGLRGSALR